MRTRARAAPLGAGLAVLVGAAVATAPQAAAISGGSGAEGEVLAGEPTLVGGEPENGVKWVVRLIDAGGSGYCSGTVITTRWVLTPAAGLHRAAAGRRGDLPWLWRDLR